ncbi:Queuine Trna-Ribosyltransferase Accessory Subunit 2 [Manis pentadactyla]|nr:Queuine Trna-Ribosyltransferase Accessory Subunit 2 [Manis pentadactyla]
MRMRGDMLTVWLCLLWVSHGACSMYLCKDFHVYCKQFCAFEYVLCALRTAFLGGYVPGVSVCDCARGVSCVTCALRAVMCSVRNVCFVCLSDFHVYCKQFCAFEYAGEMCLSLCCVLCYVLCSGLCALRTAFLGGYVPGVSVCDCARGVSCVTCALRAVMCSVRNVCFVCLSDFHVYCKQFCAFEYVLAFLGGYVRGVSVCDCALVCSMYLCKDFHVYCKQFCAFEYVLCALRTAFLGGYVRGVSVCDCARGVSCVTCALRAVMCSVRNVCFVCLSDFHVYCKQFCAFEYVLCALRTAFLGGYVPGVSVCDCARGVSCVTCALRAVMCSVRNVCFVCLSDFHVYCKQFCAFEYVLVKCVFLCVVCCVTFCVLDCVCCVHAFLCVTYGEGVLRCALRTAFLGGYVPGVSVCDCARGVSCVTCALRAVMCSVRNVCFVCLSDFHVYCKQFCAFEYVL